MHQTILRRGQDPLEDLQQCSKCCSGFHCPFCKTVFAHLYQVKYHIENHLSTAIKHDDFVIVKCNLGCRENAHFHCCYCESSVLRRIALIKHLSKCKPAQTAPLPPPPTPPPTAAKTAPPPPTPPPPTPPPAKTAPPPPPPPPPPKTAPPPPPPPPPAAAQATPSSSSSGRLRVRQQVKVTCNHCGITLNKKNLQVHINRKHRPKVIQISETRHLSCQCIDATNGIFAVDKSFFKPCSPIHVQKKTWGRSQKQICEMDDCNTNSEFAVGSGILPYECIHIKSLTFSPRSDTPPIILEEEVLSDIVTAKIFGDARKQSCLKLQNASAAAGVPLSVDVTVGGPSSKKFISVFEPKVSCYSRLGRLMVAFDMKKRSWHCPCAKPRQLCLHKSVAKWHLFQTDREMFRTKESATATDAAETFAGSYCWL